MSSVKELLRGNVIDGTGTANYIPKFIDTTSVGNSVIYDSSGNIGIGTTSPVVSLDIYGGSGQSAYASFRGNANTGLSFLVGQDSDGLPRLYTGDSRAISFWTSDTQRMRIEPSGSVLIGTTSTAFGERLTIAGYITSTDSSTVALMGSQGTNTIFGSYSDHPVLFRQNNAERMRIDSSGYVGIGMTPTYRLDVRTGGLATANTVARFGTKGNGGPGRGAKIIIAASGNGNSVDVAEIVGYQNALSAVANAAALGFNVANTSGTLTERMRITSGGYLKASNTGSYVNATANYHEIISSAFNSNALIVTNSNASGPYGIMISMSAASPDNNTNYFLRASDSTTNRFFVYSDGDVWTSDAGTLTSDETLKNTITDATPKLDDIMSLRVRNFYWNEDYHPNKTDKKLIGFIAQEFEEVFPALVSEHKIQDEEVAEDGTVIQEAVYKKGIKEAKLVPILVKAIQELKEIVDNQQQQINDLKAQLNG